MTEQKHGLNFEEHELLGLELQSIYNRMLKINTILSNRYKGNEKKISDKIVSSAQQIVNELNELRCNLDNTIVKDCPNEDVKKLFQVYFGGIRENRVKTCLPLRLTP